MNTAGLRNGPVDRRRLSMSERSSYRPNQRNSALARVKSYKAFNSFQAKKKPFATEQKPGTGGFTGGIWQQQLRKMNAADARERAESFRPEQYDYVSRDPSKNVEAQRQTLKDNMSGFKDYGYEDADDFSADARSLRTEEKQEKSQQYAGLKP